MIVRNEMAATKRLVLILGVFLALAALPNAVQAMSVQEEIDTGKKIDAQIMKENKLYPDETAQKEMEQYGQKLAKYVKRTQIPYHFKILKDNEFNAFSIPGGYVYFTDRLWNVLRKDERIGVIGHEITHVDKRHAIDAISKQQTRQTILAVILAATKAGDIWNNVASVAEQMYTLKYSRTDEEQADYGSVDLCMKAGYNPAGILLAMYKIKRFEDESGGAPPKIFSDHPPTKERLQYLKQLLVSKGIAVPEENVETASTPNKLGDVTSVNGDTVTFTSDKPLKIGDMVWLMREGWDSHYEKRTGVPAARGMVITTGQAPTAKVWVIKSAKPTQPTNGMGVYAPPVPAQEKGIGSFTLDASVAHMRMDQKPQMLERLLAIQPVWNKDYSQLVNKPVGYLVVTDPTSATGYVAVQDQDYSYAPMETNSPLVKLDDPDHERWIGPIVSIGRSGATIEVKTSRALDKSKTYEVLYPAWDKEDTYKKRIIGTAKLQSTDHKIVLKITDFSGGFSINDVQNGFDVYELKQEAK